VSRVVIATLGVTSVVLAAVVVMELAFEAGPGEFSPRRVLSDHAPTATPAGASGAPVDRVPTWATTALARPLFNSNRRPDAAPAVAEASAPGLPRLTGILVGPFGKRAIFEASSGGKARVIGEGDTIDNYTLRTIQVGQVTVVGPDGPEEWRPSFIKTPTPPPTSR